MTPEDTRSHLADWWPRVGASLLDTMLAWAIAVACIAAGNAVAQSLSGLWVLIAFVACSAYFTLTLSRTGAHNGQTLGKQAAGIRVVRDDGRPVGPGLALARETGLKFVASNVTLGIGGLVDSLWPLGEREHRALHDLIVRTHVVESRPRTVRPPLPAQTAPPAAQLAPEIARHVDAAHVIQARIREAVQRAQLPYAEVSHEVDSLVGLLQESARRAQMLYEALHETPVARVEQRLAELEQSGKTELIGALNSQLTVQRRMQAQFDRFGDEMERVVVELDTIRGSLVSVSASTYAPDQQRLAEQVRDLRDELGSVAEGMSAAYD